MKFRFLRPTILTALALGLSACGGSNTFPVYLTVDGLVYSPLVLIDNVSGKEFSITPDMLTTSHKIAYPLTLNYGDLYNIVIKPAASAPSNASGMPPHQTCVIARNQDTAGRLSEINVVVSCTVLAPSVNGTIKLPDGKHATGLTIVDGSRPAFVALDASTSYAFNGVTYNTSFTPIITAQPTDTTVHCAFTKPVNGIPKVDMGPNNLSYSGTMGDVDVSVELDCTK